ncbi:hypothetical protein B0H19DRAFT_1245558 [Mycena capillaripes]|nr:hypothetical protein B0H19DRAFT_1245558 [Mycena capillaripes]
MVFLRAGIPGFATVVHTAGTPLGQQAPSSAADPQCSTVFVSLGTGQIFYRFCNWFTSVDADRSAAITANELERALINGDWTPFELATVKLLLTISMRSSSPHLVRITISSSFSSFGFLHTDHSGTIGLNEASFPSFPSSYPSLS